MKAFVGEVIGVLELLGLPDDPVELHGVGVCIFENFFTALFMLLSFRVCLAWVGLCLPCRLSGGQTGGSRVQTTLYKGAA